MGASKEYYIRLKEEEFNNLDLNEQLYLNGLGLQVRQIETDLEKDDNHYKELKRARIKAFNDEQDYLFKKRNKMFGNGSSNFD